MEVSDTRGWVGGSRATDAAARSCLFRHVQGLMGEAMSRRIRGVFNAANFWAIVLYNVLSLNSLEFAALVGGRLVLAGKRPHRRVPGGGTLAGLFIQLFFFSPSRFPSVHPLRPVCDLLRRPAGEGKRETASPPGRSRAGQANRWRQEEGRVNGLHHPSIMGLLLLHPQRSQAWQRRGRVSKYDLILLQLIKHKPSIFKYILKLNGR